MYCIAKYLIRYSTSVIKGVVISITIIKGKLSQVSTRYKFTIYFQLNKKVGPEKLKENTFFKFH